MLNGFRLIHNNINTDNHLKWVYLYSQMMDTHVYIKKVTYIWFIYVFKMILNMVRWTSVIV
jgi:hypothetical protein